MQRLDAVVGPDAQVWGHGTVLMAVEPRIRAGVLHAAGLAPREGEEIDGGSPRRRRRPTVARMFAVVLAGPARIWRDLAVVEGAE